jgi:hypothetical protein
MKSPDWLRHKLLPGVERLWLARIHPNGSKCVSLICPSSKANVKNASRFTALQLYSDRLQGQDRLARGHKLAPQKTGADRLQHSIQTGIEK